MEQNVILSRLLNKYENSKHLTQPGISNRRIMLRVEKNELPEYDRENVIVRDRFNQAAKNLERQGLVQLEWIYGQPVFSKIILNLAHTEEIYRLVGRQHPQQAALTLYTMIQEALSHARVSWIAAWRDDICQILQQEWKLPSVCKKGEAFLKDLLKVLICYDSLDHEVITVRAFSARCLQNSKRFEQEFQEDFLRIVERYDPELNALCTQRTMGSRDKLAYLGIYPHPELYQMSGRCSIVTQSGQIDLEPVFPVGLAIPSTAVDTIKTFSLEKIRHITFLENKTNYEEYLLTELADDELAIYHGGFLSPQKHLLLEKLSSSLPDDVDIAFWADIDMGGFQMFESLQRIFPQLRPMRMNGLDVDHYAQYGLSRSKAYLMNLQDALAKGEFPLFRDAAERILSYGKTIEQEVFLSQFNEKS